MLPQVRLLIGDLYKLCTMIYCHEIHYYTPYYTMLANWFEKGLKSLMTKT